MGVHSFYYFRKSREWVEAVRDMDMGTDREHARWINCFVVLGNGG